MPRTYTRVDHTGRTYGQLTVLAFVDLDKGFQRYLFQCSCGKKKVLRVDRLTSGARPIRSCGCSRREDYTGQKFGKLTALEHVDTTSAGHQRYRFSCDCGGEITTRISKVVSGEVKGCGCLIGGIPKHGDWRGNKPTPEWLAWALMKYRCLDPNHPAYPRYGGRGITVCDQWRESYENFLADMGRRPTPKHTLERIDNDKGYEPDNCRWATRTEQARNRSDTRWVVVNGVRMSAAEAADRAGMPRGLIWQRLKYGWSVDRALSTPKKLYRGE